MSEDDKSAGAAEKGAKGGEAAANPPKGEGEHVNPSAPEDANTTPGSTTAK